MAVSLSMYGAIHTICTTCDVCCETIAQFANNESHIFGSYGQRTYWNVMDRNYVH